MIPLNEDDQIKFNEKRFAYVVLSLAESTCQYPAITISQKMTFMVTEIDVESQDELGSYEEEYDTIGDLTLGTKDYIRSLEIPKGQFKDSWEQLGALGQREGTLAEKVQTFQLPFKSMNTAVDGIIKMFGSMSVCEGSAKVNVTENVHTLYMSGMFFGTH